MKINAKFTFLYVCSYACGLAAGVLMRESATLLHLVPYAIGAVIFAFVMMSRDK